ncbi:MAG: SMP-30/gluconolactonase/LRE family protein [Planctomycetaceae bacterium]|nr:SMP-30/gluconolactonase/LRE family protein [Planctomycetaceae bacterium]
MKRTMSVATVVVLLLAMANTMVMAQQQGRRPGQNQNAFKPKLYVNLPEWCHNPDGMTVCDKTGVIYLNCPNFNNMTDGKKDFPPTLSSIDKDGKFEKLLEYPPLEETGQCGPMGLDFGPDGNLYVCDNQYFHNKDHKSRILCVEMKDGKPTGKITPVVEGLKLANALLWHNNEMWVTDTTLDLPGEFGVGGLWRFKGDEILKQTKPLKVLPNGEDKHLVVKEKVKKIGREDNSGADGMTVDKNGVIYFGNFGDGVMYAVTIDKSDDSVKCTRILDDDQYQCCDGIFYDAACDLIFINDSQKNSIRVLTPIREGGSRVRCWTLWENGDTDGSDGLLDQPCECVVRDGKMVIANFDWPFPGLRNTKFDKPHTMSVIDLAPLYQRIQQRQQQQQK